MYWPTGSASRLSLSTSSTPDDPYSIPSHPPPARPRDGSSRRRLSSSALVTSPFGRDGEVLSMARNRSGDMFATLTAEELSVWTARPKAVVTKVKRSPTSLRALGTNESVEWRPDGQVLVVLTSASKILLYALELLPSSTTVYELPRQVKNAFASGPGEGRPIPGLILRSAGELHVDRTETISCLCTTPSHLIIAISKPVASIRSIPWPASTASDHASSSKVKLEDDSPSSAGARSTELLDIQWLVDAEAHLVSITYSRPLDLFIFVTSDGRAYSVRRRRHGKLSSSSSRRFDDRMSDEDESFEEDTESDLSSLTDDEQAHGEEASATTDWDGVCFHPAPTLHPPASAATSRAPSTDLPRSAEAVGSSGSIVRLTSPSPEPPPPPSSYSTTAKTNGTMATEQQPTARPARPERPANGVCDINASFNLVALGLTDGTLAVHVIGHPRLPLRLSHTLDLRRSLNTTASGLETGQVRSCAWTSDGHALAVAWENGFSVFSVFGRLQAWGVGGQAAGGEGQKRRTGWEDIFMLAGRKVCWGPGNLELLILTPPPAEPNKRASDEQLFAIGFAKSAVTTLHSPDNTKHAFLQLDDRVMVYRGADSPDMSVINPESDVWQHIKLPAHYISSNWPIRYACISDDGRLIAVAGKRGFTHYNAFSGRWKLFESEGQENRFRVRGGLQWFGNVLIVAVDEGGDYYLRLFSRDRPLSMSYCLDEQALSSPVVLTSIYDNSLLAYTSDNTLYHFLVVPNDDGVKLRMCSSIGFEGVVGNPARVRGMSWLIPRSQHRFGDPADDLNVATVIFLIDGKLVLLRPRRAADQEVKYDMQILADRIEFYWTHLSGIGTLENSLWGWDGDRIRVWLDALTIEPNNDETDVYETIGENLSIELDFYPLSVLMDKGIIIGVNHETAYRSSLDFAIFRIMTNTHLFIHHIVRFHLTRFQMQEAVLFASHYDTLVYFAHALEILLHAVLEDEVDDGPPPTPHLSQLSLEGGGTREPSAYSSTEYGGVLPLVVDFLDHFPDALQVVVGCARKTEVRRWNHLFDVVGPPRGLFEKSLDRGLLKTAASYLLVLHNLDPLEQSSKDTIRLFAAAMAAKDWPLCKELLRFLFSLDRTGLILRTALFEAGALPPGYDPPTTDDDTVMRRSNSAPNGVVPTSPQVFASAYVPSIASPPQDADVPARRPTPKQRSPSLPSMPQAQRPRAGGLGLGSLLAKVGMSNMTSPPLEYAKRLQSLSPEGTPALLPSVSPRSGSDDDEP